MISDSRTKRKRADWTLVIAFLGYGIWSSFVASAAMNAQAVLVWGWTDEFCLGWPPARTFIEDPGSWQCDVNALFAVFAIVLFASAAMPFGFAAAWLALRSAKVGRGMAVAASPRWRAPRTAITLTQLAAASLAVSPLLLYLLVLLGRSLWGGAYLLLGAAAIGIALIALRDLHRRPAR